MSKAGVLFWNLMLATRCPKYHVERPPTCRYEFHEPSRILLHLNLTLEFFDCTLHTAY